MSDFLGKGQYDVEVDNSSALRKTAEVADAFAKAGASGSAGGLIAKGAMTAFGAASGLATKSLIELDNVQAKFRADTGATAEQAKAAGKAINEMSGRNLQPMSEIGDALGKVTTDLGLTGKAAQGTTEDFLHFARVTGREASAEVSSFDDILDAWGLTADHSREIMDKLIASHDKYGGSITANEGALSAMAPQLKAFNLTIDDGIGLLNLFASSGLDASRIPQALNSAIAKLDGRPLGDFIAELAGIEDPGKRAQRAVEVFGSKAGVGLANAIKPGMTSLDDFKVSTDAAAGATDRARDALDSTFGAKAQLMLKDFTSKVTELAGQYGPLVTGIASLGSIGSALGADKIVKPIVSALASAGKAGGEALIDAIGTATGAAGTVIGNLLAQALDPHNPFLNGVIGKSAAYLGGLWARLFGGAAAVSGFLVDLFLKLPGVGALRSALLAGAIELGTLQGTTMGKAAGAAFALGLLAVVADIASQVSGPLNQLGQDLGDKFRPAVFEQIGDSWERWRADAGWPFGQRRPEWMPDVIATALGFGKDVGGAVSKSVTEGMSDLANFPGKLADDLPPQVAAATPKVAAAWKHLVLDPAPGPFSLASKAAMAAAREAAGNYATGITNGWDAAERAWETFLDASKNPISKAKRIAKLEGELTSKELADGLASNDPYLRAQAELAKQAIEDELGLLRGNANNIGKAAGTQLGKGLDSKQGVVEQSGADLAQEARDEFNRLRNESYGIGAGIGSKLSGGLYSKLGTWSYTTALYAGKLEALLKLSSPAKEGPMSRNGGPEGWAERGATLYARGWSRLIPMLDSIFSQLPTPQGAGVGLAIAPGITGQPMVAGGASSLVQSTNVGDIHVHLDVDKLVAADALQVRDLSRRLGSEVRLAMTRTSVSFGRPNA